jgi:hypothetical protein
MGVAASVMARRRRQHHVQRAPAARAQDDALNAQKDSAAKAEATRPQASKAPSVQAVQASQAGAGQAGGAPGVAQTFLTGASGVDPSTLNLGKSTLLGGGGGG